MIYRLMRALLALGFRFYFKKRYYSNVEFAPEDKPLIIASNHPGAFMDPILIGMSFKKPIYFLVRGDVFENKIAAEIFSWFNMIPIFRIDEGFEKLGRNDATKKKVAEVLSKNG